MEPSSYDVIASIAHLYVYPIKSCAGVEVPEVMLTEGGLEFDRAWMVVNAADGVFVSQRELPRMQLIQPKMKQLEMVLRAPGMLALHIAFDRVEAPCTVRVWKDEVAAYDMGDIAAQWFSDFLSEPGRPRKLRLVRFDPDHRRLADAKWTQGREAPVEFADGFPLLVIGDGSMAVLNERLAAEGHPAVTAERFRPNIVLKGVEAHDENVAEHITFETDEGEAVLLPVKPCIRCSIPDIDPATAVSSPEVGNTLRSYRSDPRVDGGITFGMNAVVIEGDGFLLKTGQRVGASLKFD